MARRRKKLVGKSSWFKNPPKSNTEDGPKHHPRIRKKKSSEVKERKTPVSILFVPQTPFGALANKLKEKEKLLSEIRVKSKTPYSIVQIFLFNIYFVTKLDC